MMLKLAMKDNIIKKHRDYIWKESKIKEKLNALLEDDATIPIDIKKTRELNENERMFIRYLLKHIQYLGKKADYSKSIFLMKPEQMKEELETISRNYKDVYDHFLIKDDAFSKAILQALGYENNFIKKGNKWGAYKYTELLDLCTCPYCNIDDASTYDESRAELDHFLPKSRYPYFSMSIYNLIPSCHRCNASYKKDKELSYAKNINLFETAMNSNLITFSFSPTNLETIIGNDPTHIKVKANVSADILNADRLKNNNEIFGIMNRYNHKKVKKKIHAMIKNRYNLDESLAVLKSLNCKALLLECDENDTDEEIIKKEYGKLKLDIYNELEKKFSKGKATVSIANKKERGCSAS